MSSIPVTSFEWIINMHKERSDVLFTHESAHYFGGQLWLEQLLAKSGFNFSYIYHI